MIDGRCLFPGKLCLSISDKCLQLIKIFTYKVQCQPRFPFWVIKVVFSHHKLFLIYHPLTLGQHLVNTFKALADLDSFLFLGTVLGKTFHLGIKPSGIDRHGAVEVFFRGREVMHVHPGQAVAQDRVPIDLIHAGRQHICLDRAPDVLKGDPFWVISTLGDSSFLAGRLK